MDEWILMVFVYVGLMWVIYVGLMWDISVGSTRSLPAVRWLRRLKSDLIVSRWLLSTSASSVAKAKSRRFCCY